MDNYLDNFEETESEFENFPMFQDLFEKQLDHSMRWTYERIQKIGIETWMDVFPYQKKRKIRIIESMMLWFADPEREEYEKSAYLKKALETIKEKTI